MPSAEAAAAAAAEGAAASAPVPPPRQQQQQQQGSGPHSVARGASSSTAMEFRNVVFNAARDGKLRRLKVRKEEGGGPLSLLPGKDA